MPVFAIIGSRNFGNDELVRQTIARYVTTDDMIVSGGAAGVDTIADQMSVQLQCRFLRIPAQWAKYGRAAGHKRNPDIIEEAEHVLAFWNGASSGTKGGIKLAQYKRPLLVVYPDGRTKCNKQWELLYEQENQDGIAQ